MSNTLRVLMLGYQRVGKTSLLASMYKATQDELAKNYRFQIKPGTDSTAEFLSDAEDRLASATEFIVNETIEPSDTWRTFLFKISSENETILELEFLDYRGGQLRDASSEDAKKVREWLQSCLAIIIPIDSPALMDSKGEWANLNDKWNNPKGISSIIRSELDRNSPRLVILSPVKCEKYLQEGRGEELRRKVETVYEYLLDYLKGETESRRNCVVVIPVQTIGGAKFSSFEKQADGTVQGRFVNPEQKYKPEDGDQLLRYVARFALARIMEKNLVRIDDISGRIVDDLGWCPPKEKVNENEENKNERGKLENLVKLLKSGLLQFAQGCKQDRVLKILMGASLLDSGR